MPTFQSAKEEVGSVSVVVAITVCTGRVEADEKLDVGRCQSAERCTGQVFASTAIACRALRASSAESERERTLGGGTLYRPDATRLAILSRAAFASCCLTRDEGRELEYSSRPRPDAPAWLIALLSRERTEVGRISRCTDAARDPG